MSDEVSPGGSEILRHEAREREFEPTGGDAELIEAVERHLESAFGEHDGGVYHEIVSDLVHLDVHFVPATAERPATVLMTSGMAERPMTVPEGLEDHRYAELMLALPPEWPLEDAAFEDENVYWPIRLLKDLARLPHDYETFLYPAHTIPNGDPPEAYADGTSLCGALIGPSLLAPDGFDSFELPDGRTVRVHAVYPLHGDEMAFKLENGAEELWERLEQAGVTELVDPHRESVVGRRRRLFGRG